MDSMSRKRKLSDFRKNVHSMRKSGVRVEGIFNQEENELNACNQGTNGEEDVEQLTKEVLQEKPTKRLATIADPRETRGEEEIRARERSIFQDEDDDDEDDDDGGGGGGDGDCQDVGVGSNTVRKEIMWFSTDYIEDIIAHEMHKESLHRLSDKFCRKFDINPTGREILIDWLISVQVHLKAENSTLHLAVALLDIMLDGVNIPLGELQAAAVAAFWVAYKYLQGSLSMKSLLNLCAGSVTRRMIEANEIRVLQTSRLIQAGGCLSVFFNYLLYKIFGFRFPAEIYYCGLYFVEIMLLQFIFVDCSSYEKAVTAVFTSLAVFGCPGHFDRIDVSRFVTKRRLQNIYRRLMRSLRLLYSDRNGLKNLNVYLKYKSSRYFKISVHPYLRCFASA